MVEAEAYLYFAFSECVGHWRALATLKVVDRHSAEEVE